MQMSRFSNTLRRSIVPVTATAAVLLVSGCGGGTGDAATQKGPETTSASPSAAGVVLDVTGNEYSFSPSTVKAAAGQTTVRFTNKGVVEHDFSIAALGVHLVAKPGKTDETTLTLKPGSYEITCTVPAHLQSGMQGKLVVR